eukprot:Colp12_sorted_trinity150504_noHs@35962
MDDITWRRVQVAEEGKPLPRRYHTAVEFENKMYVFGGARGSKLASKDLYCFDLETKKWALQQGLGKTPSELCAHMCTVHNGKLYVFGGWNFSKPSNIMYTFDFATNEWSTIVPTEGAQWPSARFHPAGVHDGNDWYMFGGSSDINTHMNDLYVFHFDFNTWEMIPASRQTRPRERSTSLLYKVGSTLYLLGGITGDGGYEVLSDLHRIDLDADPLRWECVDGTGTLPFTGRPLPIVSYKGLLFVYGGYDGKNVQGRLHCTNTLKDPATWIVCDAWLELDDNDLSTAATNAGLNPIPRYGHSAILVGDTMTIFGGSGSTYLNDVIQFTLLEPPL